jgi:hypothetical protein
MFCISFAGSECASVRDPHGQSLWPRGQLVRCDDQDEPGHPGFIRSKRHSRGSAGLQPEKFASHSGPDENAMDHTFSEERRRDMILPVRSRVEAPSQSRNTGPPPWLSRCRRPATSAALASRSWQQATGAQ